MIWTIVQGSKIQGNTVLLLVFWNWNKLKYFRVWWSENTLPSFIILVVSSADISGCSVQAHQMSEFHNKVLILHCVSSLQKFCNMPWRALFCLLLSNEGFERKSDWECCHPKTIFLPVDHWEREEKQNT